LSFAFVAIGARTARRNFQRSLLAIVSIAVATMTFIGAGRLGVGTPGIADTVRRQVIGGDILVFPEALATNDVKAHPNAYWELYRRSPDQSGLLAKLMPDVVTVGILTDTAHYLGDLDRGATEIRGLPNVTGIYPIYEYPVVATFAGGQQVRTSIRPRFRELDAELRFEDNIVDGRYLSTEPMEALVENWVPDVTSPGAIELGYGRMNGRRVVMEGGEPFIGPDFTSGVGEPVQLILPRVTTVAGEQRYDYTDPLTQVVEIVGTVQFPTDLVSWGKSKLTIDGLEWTQRSNPEIPAMFQLEQRYWTTNQLQVSWETFQQLTAAAGLTEPEPTALAVMVRQMSLVNDTADTIAEVLGAGTVISVPSWFRTQDLLPEPMVMTPTADASMTRMPDPDWAPKTFTPPPIVLTMLITLAYVMAGTLYAGNMYILLTQRKKELAIMKVLGAQTSQVLTTVMTELGLLAVGGALLGLAVMSPPVLWQFATSRITMTELMGSYGSLALQIMGMAVAASVVFGGLPAYIAVTKTIEQVLYHEE